MRWTFGRWSLAVRLFITLMFIFPLFLLAEEEYTHPVSVYITSPAGIPDGADNLSTPNEEQTDMLTWTQNGLWFMTWLSDYSGEVVSDTFFPGDDSYGFSYWSDIDDTYGYYSFSLQNFKNVGRTSVLDSDINDTLHIRLRYEDGGTTYEWGVDHVFTEPPAGSEVEFYAVLASVSGNDAPIAPVGTYPLNDDVFPGEPEVLVWDIPIDSDGDDLHFKVDIDNDSTFSSIDYSYDSQVSSSYFAPSVPVTEGTGACSLNVPVSCSLAPGFWYWRVSAFDGTAWSTYSVVKKFTVSNCTFNHAVNVFISTPVGVPTGADNLSTPNEEHTDMLTWKQNGLWFMTWLSDVSSGSVSDTFFAGDDSYGHTYYGEVSSYGFYGFALDNFSVVNRTTNFSAQCGDTLHIRLRYDYGGSSYTWSYDSCIAFSPPGSGLDIFAEMELGDVNLPPAIPDLTNPSDGEIVYTFTNLGWAIPSDPNGDDLYFEVELDTDVDFSSVAYSYDSYTDNTGFSASAPVTEGTGTLTLDPPGFAASNGLYYWRTRAFDGTLYSGWSDIQSFTIADSCTFSQNVTISLNSAGGVPSGDSDLSIPNESHGDYLSWKENGLWFMVWLSDVSDGAVSDTFFPGDIPSGFSYDGSGDLTFSLDDFSELGRILDLAAECGDTLHIRTEWVDGTTHYSWSKDTILEEAPIGGLAISGTMLAPSNTRPETPSLVAPLDGIVVSDEPAEFRWNIPSDYDGDDLWFRVEIDSDGDFGLCEYSWDSWTDAANFSPSQPVAEGTGEGVFSTPVGLTLTAGIWYWRVTAYDGTDMSVSSEVREFTIGGTCTFIQAVNVFITSPAGIPTGIDNLSVPNEAHDDMYDWRQDGLWYMTWISDVSEGTVSDTFFPGDDSYGHTYYGEVGSYGFYGFALDNFSAVTRNRNISAGCGDTLHIRLLYQSAGNIYEYAYDSCLASAPPGTGLDIFAEMTLTPNTAPGVAGLVSPSADAVVYGAPNIFTWSVPDDIDGDSLHFRLEIDADNSFSVVDYVYESWVSETNFSSLPAASGDELASYDPPEVFELASGDWYWRVTAYDGDDEGTPTASRHLYVNGDPEIPILIAPSDMSWDSEEPDSFRWSVPTDPESDRLYFELQLDGDGDFSTVDHTYQSWLDASRFSPAQPVISGTGECLFVTPFALSLSSGTYYWRVRAYDGGDYGAWSDIFSFGINTSPPAPTLTEPLADSYYAATPPKFKWDINADADAESLTFKIEIDADGDFSSVDYTYESSVTPGDFNPPKGLDDGAEIQFISPMGLSLGDGHWFWRVKAADSVSYGHPSSAWHFEIDSSEPVSVIEYPADSTIFGSLDSITVYGRATYAVAEIESIRVSFDGGSSWEHYEVTDAGEFYSWSVRWAPPGDGSYVIQTKAVCHSVGVVESSVETGRNEIELSFNSSLTGPMIDVSPARLMYEYTRGNGGGGFARAIELPDVYEVEHNIYEGLTYMEIEVRYPYPHLYSVEDGFWNVEINGLDNFGLSGEPYMPYDNVRAMLPQGMRITQLSVIEAEPVAMPGRFKINYGKPPVPLNGDFDEKYSRGEANPAIYNSSEPFPYNPVNFSNQSVRGFSIGLINVRPVYYVPSEGKLFYYSSMRIRVELEPDISDEYVQYRGSDLDMSRAANFVENPELANTYVRPPQFGALDIMAVPADSSFQYVILTTSAFQDSFQVLVDWKKSRGITATTYLIEDVLSEYSGTDDQEKIRNFIIDIYNNWETEYVLLGGDDEFIPVRNVYGRIGTDIFVGSIPADIYYSCLDGNYNNNANGLWGEVTDGVGGTDVDWFADVYVGRAPVDDIGDISNFVAKTIDYESNPFASYHSEIAMAGEYLWTSFCGAAYGGNSLDMVSPYLPTEWTITELYQRDGGFASGASLTSIMNSGTHMVHHLGHSNYNSNMQLTHSDVISLSNTEYFFAYSQGCYANAFDEATSGSQGSISETFVCSTNGAFGYIGNTRYGWGYACNPNGPSNKFHVDFVDALFKGDVRNLGEANEASKTANIGLLGFYGAHRWVAHELCLMGDPETPIHSPGGTDIVTIYNHGTSDLHVTDIQGRNSVISAFPSSFTIAADDSQDIYVTVVTGAYSEGLHSEEIIIVSDDGDEPNKSVPISITISGAPYRTGRIAPSTAGVALSTSTVEHGSGTTVEFSGGGSDPDGYITSFEWIGALPETIDVAEEFEDLSRNFISSEPYFVLNPDTLAPGTYSVAFTVRDNDGNWSVPHIESFEITEVLDVDGDSHRPEDYNIMGVYPNPFNSSMSVEYILSESAVIEILVYDMSGREIQVIEYGKQDPGVHTSVWAAPSNVESGVYLVKLRIGDKEIIKRALLIK